uniref:SCP domain-containing protein n=1 Tax=Mesocestoides corti TaxID=53468 RepID=A0A5K3EWT3_MESCO
MVRASSTEVGCAIEKCDGAGSSIGKGYLMACLYKPGSEVIRAKPYTKGPTCSHCPKDWKCFRGQCYHESLPQDSRIEPPPSLLAALP